METKTIFNVCLPICTDNHMYVMQNKKRVKSPKYKKWLKQAGWEYISIRNTWIRQGTPIFTYADPVTLKIEVTDAVKKGNSPHPRDLQNHTKQSIDFLVNMGLLLDDDLVNKVVLEWAPAKEVSGLRYTIDLHDVPDS